MTSNAKETTNSCQEYSPLEVNEEILFNEWLKSLFNLNNTSDIGDQINSTLVDNFRLIFRSILNKTQELARNPELMREKYIKNALIITFYTLIIVVSLFGNLLVCKVILSKRAHRLRTTNILIVNLTISDLIMTVFTIPVTIARIILDNWPLGSTLCILAPFVQVTTVYVSTISMAFIALDRYQGLVNPLTARFSHRFPKLLIIIMIWVLSAILSIPHSIFNRSVPLFTYQTIYRCRVVYPEPKLFYRQLLTMTTFLTQYLLPLTATLFTYALIVLKIFRKVKIGEMTEQQLSLRSETKKKTIKMLMTVVVVFAVCWLPINSYHLINDFIYFESQAPVGLNAYLLCHWLAFSSVCWNPFIYFGLNPYYRKGLRKLFFRNSGINTNNRNNNSYALNTRSSFLLSRNNSKTCERKLNLSLTKHNIKCDNNCDNSFTKQLLYK